MPVTIRPQPTLVGVIHDLPVHSSQELLQHTSKAWTIKEVAMRRRVETNKKIGPEDRPVLRTSFTDLDAPVTSSQSCVVPYGNGFVDGIIRAFQQDLHLVLRPDDVWLAILVQFSFYVNGHAEQLRETFVSHKDKKQLVLDVTPATLDQIDVGALAQRFAGLMEEFIVEDGVRDWLLPEFSTTTDDDKSIAAIIMMATMKAYFEYVMLCGCGFPSVTLEGERKDWEDIRERVRRFARYGDEPAEWATYLGVILDSFIKCFDFPDDPSVKDFWMRVCHQAGNEGSGMGLDTISGWITAFCFWNEEGCKIRSYSDEDLGQWGRFGHIDRKRLVLGGVGFPIIRRKEIPKSVSEVPVKVVDIGQLVIYETTLVAGLIGMTAWGSKSGKSECLDTVQPRSGWWMLLDKTQPLLRKEV